MRKIKNKLKIIYYLLKYFINMAFNIGILKFPHVIQDYAKLLRLTLIWLKSQLTD